MIVVVLSIVPCGRRCDAGFGSVKKGRGFGSVDVGFGSVKRGWALARCGAGFGSV